MTASTEHQVTEIRLVPELVSALNCTREELVKWIKETPQLVEGELVEEHDPDLTEDDIPF